MLLHSACKINSTYFCSVFFPLPLFQVFDVFTDKTVTLKDSMDFVVSVNPSGVVMWYVSAPAELNLHHFYQGSRLQAPGRRSDDENAVPRVFLWSSSASGHVTPQPYCIAFWKSANWPGAQRSAAMIHEVLKKKKWNHCERSHDLWSWKCCSCSVSTD